MKVIAFECGILLGMAAVCLLPPVRKEIKKLTGKVSDSITPTKKVLLAKGRKLKEDAFDAASDLREDVKDAVESLLDETESIDMKGLTPSLKKKLGKIKAHASSLRSLTE